MKNPEGVDDVDDGGGIVTGTHIAGGNLGVETIPAQTVFHFVTQSMNIMILKKATQAMNIIIMRRSSIEIITITFDDRIEAKTFQDNSDFQ